MRSQVMQCVFNSQKGTGCQVRLALRHSKIFCAIFFSIPIGRKRVVSVVQGNVRWVGRRPATTRRPVLIADVCSGRERGRERGRESRCRYGHLLRTGERTGFTGLNCGPLAIQTFWSCNAVGHFAIGEQPQFCKMTMCHPESKTMASQFMIFCRREFYRSVERWVLFLNVAGEFRLCCAWPLIIECVPRRKACSHHQYLMRRFMVIPTLSRIYRHTRHRSGSHLESLSRTAQ